MSCVVEGGASDGERVDASVVVEASVFGGNNGLQEALRQVRQGYMGVVRVESAGGIVEKAPLAVEDLGRFKLDRRGRRRRPGRNVKEQIGGDDGHEAGEGQDSGK